MPWIVTGSALQSSRDIPSEIMAPALGAVVALGGVIVLVSELLV